MSKPLKKHLPLFLFSRTQNILRNIFVKILAPISCKLCGKESDLSISICNTCAEDFLGKFLDYRLRCEKNFCQICGAELISEFNICLRCKNTFDLKEDKSEGVKTERFFERNFALFPYIGVGQKLVADWKNKGMRNYSKLFSRYLLKFLDNKPELRNLSIVPVPPRPAKIKVKGWDQISDLAMELRSSGKIISKCLNRSDGVSQKVVKKLQRAKNLKGKFFLNPKFRNKMPKNVILLDDIITTGATINECSKILNEAGCKKIYSLCLFFN